MRHENGLLFEQAGMHYFWIAVHRGRRGGLVLVEPQALLAPKGKQNDLGTPLPVGCL